MAHPEQQVTHDCTLKTTWDLTVEDVYALPFLNAATNSNAKWHKNSDGDICFIVYDLFGNTLGKLFLSKELIN